MSNINKRATEMLIENGVLVADTLRRLADNEIDSDYFAICHTNENGTEIECELAITDYARQSAGIVDDLVNALEAAEKRIAELSSAVIAPGIMRCAGCGFVLTKNSINMVAGTITAGDSKTEPCPNGCGPLWPVTWKEQAIEMRDNSEQWFEELQEARQRIAELELKLEAADKLQDSAFRHGLQHGFSFGQTDNQAGFEECLSAYGTGKGE